MNEGQTVAVCHEWITTYGGSEQVAARIAASLDAEEVFTYAADPQLAERLFPGRTVTVVGRLGNGRFGRRHWQWLLPFMPGAWKRLDLDRFDVVITSAHSCVNAIDVPHGTHISYCHTPMRYAWQWRSEIRRLPLPLRPIWPLYAYLLRLADCRWAQRVDLFVANSQHVAERVHRAYGKNAEVIPPPVDTDFWTPGDGSREKFFLAAGRLVAYKRVDVCVEAAQVAGVPLVIAGSGAELSRLRRLSTGADVTFVIDPSRERLRDLYRKARALVFAGVEDFGMTLVEAQACGTPVIALRRGGAMEAVQDGITGMLYDQPEVSSLAEAMTTFDPAVYEVAALRQHAERFGLERFDASIRDIVSRALSQ